MNADGNIGIFFVTISENTDMKFLLLLLLCFYFQFISAQENKDEKIYDSFVIEKLPEFPGGASALNSYLAQNINYPDSAKLYNIQGKVFIRFIITEEGKIENIEIVKSINSYLDNEAIRIMQNMPKWKPGSVKGKNVKCNIVVPVNFKLH